MDKYSVLSGDSESKLLKWVGPSIYNHLSSTPYWVEYATGEFSDMIDLANALNKKDKA